MATKNEALLLNSGIQGEVTALALEAALSFTRIEIGDANGGYPIMDKTITALVNKVADGEVLSHIQDPDVNTQRIVEMSISPNDNYNAVEVILYAQYGEIEFPHTYIRLAAPFPVRTPENGGSQATLTMKIAINDVGSDFSIVVLSDLSFVTQGQLKDASKPITVDGNSTAIIDKNRLHVFINYADLQIPSTEGEQFRFMVDDSVDLEAGKCRVVAPIDDQTLQPKEDMHIGKNIGSHANITRTGVIHSAVKINGVWKI